MPIKEGNILYKTAERLGTQDLRIINKSEEFLRSLQGKGGLKGVNDLAKTILSLDLAATVLGNSFDRESAIKLSGLKKSMYQNSLHIIEKVLNLDRPITVSDICVKLGCTVIKEVAEEILDKYISRDNKIKDLKHPQYAAAAVHTACKLKKVNIEKSQCMEVSRLKQPSQWKELTVEFEKFASLFGIGSSKKIKKNELKNIFDALPEDIGLALDELCRIDRSQRIVALAQGLRTAPSDNKATNNENIQDDEIEEYEVWRKRILDEAYKAVNKTKTS